MSQLLALMTAYGAVAIAVWLTALLYPKAIPAAAPVPLDNRWRTAGGFALALLATVGIAWLQGKNLLLPDNAFLPSLVNLLAIYAPLLVFVAARRDREAVLVPRVGVLRSCGIGFVLGLAALAAWFSIIGSADGPLSALPGQVLQARSLLNMVEAVLFALVLAALLSLVADGWSRTLALVLTTLAILLLHVAVAIMNGFDNRLMISALVAGAIGLGLFSAILATRNVVWFIVVDVLLQLAADLGS